jgi:hypothetical protein
MGSLTQLWHSVQLHSKDLTSDVACRGSLFATTFLLLYACGMVSGAVLDVFQLILSTESPCRIQTKPSMHCCVFTLQSSCKSLFAASKSWHGSHQGACSLSCWSTGALLVRSGRPHFRWPPTSGTWTNVKIFRPVVSFVQLCVANPGGPRVARGQWNEDSSAAHFCMQVPAPLRTLPAQNARSSLLGTQRGRTRNCWCQLVCILGMPPCAAMCFP